MIQPIGARGIITPGLGFIHPYPASGPFGGHATLGTDLVSYWKLDETSGTTATDSKEDNNGTITGATVNQTGKIGKAVLFDHSSEKIVIANESNFDFERTQEFSASMWFYLNSTGVNRFPLTKQEASGNYRGWGLWIQTNNKLRFDLVSAGGSNNYLAVEATNAFSSGSWIHFGFSYSGSSTVAGVKLYINGSVDSTATSIRNTLTATILNAISVEIGNRNGAFNFDGLIDEVGIWNKELSSSEFSDLYNSGDGLTY
jgi:hypothetical protein